MNTKDYFKDMYTDFLGVEAGPKFSVKVIKDEKTQEDEIQEQTNQEEMTSLINKINDLYITEESKNLLKKIIEYMRKYNEKIETQYVPFRIIINVNNNFLLDEITNILYESSKYYKYINNTTKKDISFFNIEENYEYGKYGFLSINSLSGANTQEEKTIKKFIYELSEYLDKNEKNITIISGNNEELDTFFLGKNDFKTNYFDFEIKGINPDVQDIYNEVLEKTNTDKQVELLDYITQTYNNDLIKKYQF